MAKIVRNNLGDFLIVCLIFSMMTGWIFSGWPLIWNNPPLPPEIQDAWAAEAPYTYDFVTTAEYWTGKGGDYTTDTYQDSGGNPDGCLETSVVNKNQQNTNAGWYVDDDGSGAGTLTWEDLGVPQGATVTQVDGKYDWQCSNADNVQTSSASGDLFITDSSDGNATTLETGETFGTTTSWATKNGTGPVNMPAGLQDSNTSIKIKLLGNLRTSSGKTGGVIRQMDNVVLTITYTIPADTDSAVEVHGDGAQANFNLNPLNDTEGEKFSVLKFQVRDTATSDALPTLIDQITINISGTGGSASTDIAWAELYDDSGAAPVATAASITNSAITFGAPDDSGGDGDLDTVASGGTIKYTVNIYMLNDTLTATDTQIYTFGINDSDVDEDSSESSQMRGDATAVTDVDGTITVTHSKIIFSTQPPATAVINTDFSGTIAVSATDVNGNIDKDFPSENITLSAVIDVTHAAPNGVLSSTDTGERLYTIDR